MTAKTALNPNGLTYEGETDRRAQAAPAPGGPGGASAPGAASMTAAGPDRNPVELRDRTERRVTYDRRQFIRFEDDRRSGVDRRAGHESWQIS